MFTGIIEEVGRVVEARKEGSNFILSVACSFLSELKVDQSISHNGACLTVVALAKDSYTVIVIEESLRKTNLGTLAKDDAINLERAMKLGERLDGHLVQGHVDSTAKCTHVADTNGSWLYSFEFEAKPMHAIVEKGSISVNGVSLTVVDAENEKFSVAIIPYTREHTNFGQLVEGSIVNVEYDLIGKYVASLLPRS